MPIPNDGSKQYLQWRQARRDVARRHHPDVGGDAAVYLRRINEVDRDFRRGDRTSGQGIGAAPDLDLLLTRPQRVLGARNVRLTRRRGRKAIARMRARLPRGFPGARRYFDL